MSSPEPYTTYQYNLPYLVRDPFRKTLLRILLLRLDRVVPSTTEMVVVSTLFSPLVRILPTPLPE